MTEADVFTYLEKFCNPDSDEGEWIATLDMAESGMVLKLVDMGTVSTNMSSADVRLFSDWNLWE